MQPASEECSYLEELSCEEDSLKENRFCFKQNQDTDLPSNSYNDFKTVYSLQVSDPIPQTVELYFISLCYFYCIRYKRLNTTLLC